MEALGKSNTHGKVLLFIIMFCILAVSVSAIPFIPSGDIDGVGIRKIINFTNISADKFCNDNNTCYTITELATGSDTNDSLEVAIQANRTDRINESLYTIVNESDTNESYRVGVVEDRVDQVNLSLYTINNETAFGRNATVFINQTGNIFGIDMSYFTGLFYIKSVIDDAVTTVADSIGVNITYHNASILNYINSDLKKGNTTVEISVVKVDNSSYGDDSSLLAGQPGSYYLDDTNTNLGINTTGLNNESGNVGLNNDYLTGIFYIKSLVDSAISIVADSIGLNITYHNASVVSFVNTEVSALANNTYTVAETNTQLVDLNNSALARETKYNKTKVQQDINDSAIRLNYLDLNGNITMAFGNISSGRNPDGEQGITMRVIKSADYFLGKGGFFNIYNSTGHWIAYIRESDGLINSRRHGQSDNWYQAYLWGDHAVAGYAVNASILNYINSDLKKGNTTTEIQETINDSTAISPTRVEVLTTVYIGGSGQVTRTNYTLSGCVIYENSSAVWTQC